MPIQARCPKCHLLLSTASRKAGQVVACPNCQSSVHLMEAAELDSRPEVSRGPAVFSEQPASGPHPMIYGVLALLLLGGLFIGLFAAGFLTVKQAEPPSLEIVGPQLPRAATPGPTSPAPVVPPAEPARLGHGIASGAPPAPASRQTFDNSPPAEPANPMPPVPSEPSPPPQRTLSADPGSGQAPASTKMKRRSLATDEELRKQLVEAPELKINPVWIPGAMQSLSRPGAQPGPNRAATPQTAVKEKVYMVNGWGDLVGFMPGMRMGHECELGPEPADRLHVLSKKLRMALDASIRRDNLEHTPDPQRLRDILLNGVSPTSTPQAFLASPPPLADGPKEWLVPDAVPALVQLLTAEARPIRGLLIEMLAKIKGKEASAALAQRAVFDLSLELREAAVTALGERPAEEFEHVLLDGFRYPWPPAADHAAEAIVALKLRETMPRIVEFLQERDPLLVTPPPATKPGVATKEGDLKIREVVRVNHMANCLLCHKPSSSADDKVRGVVPVPGQPLPSASGQGYEASSGTFVRADITYLRQDFSVIQPVATPGPWPSHQRFDYLIRQRSARPDERPALMKKLEDPVSEPLAAYPQREAALWALRELSGMDVGVRYEDWKVAVRER